MAGFNYAGLGTVLQGVGSIYGAYNQNKMSKNIFNLQKDAYRRELERKERSQAKLNYASDNFLTHRDDIARLDY